MYCPACGKQLPDDANFCMQCGRRLTTEPACGQVPARGWAAEGLTEGLFTQDEREQILEHRIQELAAMGYVLANRGRFTCQMVKGKGFSRGEIATGVTLVGVDFLAAGLQKQPAVYVQITEDGRTQLTHSDGRKEAMPAPRRRRR